MKKLIITLLLLCIVTVSCQEQEFKLLDTQFVDGTVSAIERHDYSMGPLLYVQTSKDTYKVRLPIELKNRWKVGDSCLIIVEQYEKVNNK